MLTYATHFYRHPADRLGVLYGTNKDLDDAVQEVELAYDQTGGMWTITVQDERTGRLYDTVYACGAA